MDKLFAEAGILNKRLPFQADATMRKKLNDGEFYFVDQHLSHTSEMLRQGTLDKIDLRYCGSGIYFRRWYDYSIDIDWKLCYFRRVC